MAHTPPRKNQGYTATILFVCEHGSAKSVVAAALFNRLAAQQGLQYAAVSRGTDPDTENHPAAVAGLAADGLEPQAEPRRLAPADLATAAAVVAFSPLPAGYASSLRLREWTVPPVSENYAAARDAIASHIEDLLADLRQRL